MSQGPVLGDTDSVCPDTPPTSTTHLPTFGQPVPRREHSPKQDPSFFFTYKGPEASKSHENAMKLAHRVIMDDGLRTNAINEEHLTAMEKPLIRKKSALVKQEGAKESLTSGKDETQRITKMDSLPLNYRDHLDDNTEVRLRDDMCFSSAQSSNLENPDLRPQNQLNNDNKTFLWVTPDGFRKTEVMTKIRKAAMHDHLRKMHTRKPHRAPMEEHLISNKSSPVKQEETKEFFTFKNEWALGAVKMRPTYLKDGDSSEESLHHLNHTLENPNSPPSASNGLITPPDSRRTSGEDEKPEQQVKWLLPSTQEVLGSLPPPSSPVPWSVQNNASALTASCQHLSAQSESSVDLHPHGLTANDRRHSTALDVSSKSQRNSPINRCYSCNRTETPEWRRGPNGARTLCNACGLHYEKLSRKMVSSRATIENSDMAPKSGIFGPQARVLSEGLIPGKPTPIFIGHGGPSSTASRITDLGDEEDVNRNGNTSLSHLQNNPSPLNEMSDYMYNKPLSIPEDGNLDVNLTGSDPIQRRHTMSPFSEGSLPKGAETLPATPFNPGFAKYLDDASISPSTTRLDSRAEDSTRKVCKQDVITEGQSASWEDSATDYSSEDQQYSEEFSSSCTSTPQDQYSTDCGGQFTQLLPKKRRLVDSLMRDFYSMFNSSSGVVTYGNDSNTSSRHQSTGSDSSANNTQLPSGGGSKRKASDEDSPTRESNDEDSTKRPRRGEPPLDDDQANSSKKLACPYFKRSPRKYQRCRSCPGPGWDTVHRLKEHLYRRHALPIQCPRCYKSFKIEIALKDHQRSLQSCEISEEIVLEGFDKDQEKRLRSRKRLSPDQSEEDKWREVYRILFPEDAPLTIPSPYYDYDLTLEQKTDKLSGPTGFARYEEFLSRELPRHVRRELELAMDSELEPIEDKLKSQLVDIVRNCQEKLFRMYQQSIQPSTSPEDPIRDVLVPEPTSTFGSSSNVVPSTWSDNWEIEDQFTPVAPPSYPAMELSQLDQSFLSGTFLDLGQASDAGHNSLDSLFQPLPSSVYDAWG